MTYAEFEDKVLGRHPRGRRSIASTDSERRSRSPPTRRASSSRRSRSSQSQPPLHPQQFVVERDRLLNILRPDPNARFPASRQIEQAEALKALSVLFKRSGYEDVRVSWIDGRVDILYSTVDSGTTSVGTEQRTGPRALPPGIPDGLMRPTLAAEAKKYKYVTKAIKDIARVAEKESQSDSDTTTTRGTKKNHRYIQHNENTSDLLRQGGGYMIFYRIMYCELFDTRSHIFMHAPGLNIDKYTTTPELWRRGLEASGPIQVAIFGEEDLDLLPLARLGLRNLARKQTPWDVIV